VPATKDDITLLLRRIDEGERGAMDQLMDVVYGDLERMAASQLRKQFGQRAEQITLEPAALVNESFLQLIKQRKGFDNRGQFFAIATRLMLRVMKDYRRQKLAAMRGGPGIGESGDFRMTLAIDRLPGAGVSMAEHPRSHDLVEIDALADALDKMEAQDPRSADILKMRVVWGMSVAEIAEALDISPSTIDRDWKWAKAWLAEELGLLGE
jgi:RNA polymerase sigma factor (TIGR02999 family)